MTFLIILSFFLGANYTPFAVVPDNNAEPGMEVWAGLAAETQSRADTVESDLSHIPEGYREFAPEVWNQAFLLDYTGFILEFDTAHRNARWVSYMLCSGNLGDGVERSRNFRMDRRLRNYCPRNKEYSSTGYDKGHLAPAADMCYSTKSMYDSFYLSNASPQTPSFNRGIWKRLEGQIRQFASEKDTVWVVTGPVLRHGLPVLPNTNISIPELFYKVIVKPDTEEPKGIAFLMYNTAGTGTLQDYAVSIDSVEVLTGINFFPQLDPETEKKVEGSVDITWWFGEN